MGTKYSTIAVSGYNATPPADDGSAVASNQVKWSYIKTKLSDPLNTFAAAVDAALLLALDMSVRQVTASGNTAATDHNRTVEIAPSVSTAVTISLADAATMTAGYVVRIKNSSTIAQTVGRVTAGDTLDGATKNITLGPNQSIVVQVNAGEDGYVSLNNNPLLYDFTDPSKSARFVLSGITTATQRTITVPDANIVLSGSASALTSGRVPYATTGGLLTDAANLTFDGTTLTAHTLTVSTGNTNLAGNLTVTGASAIGLDIRGTGRDRLQVQNEGAGSGVSLLFLNNGGTDYEPAVIAGESVTLKYRTGVSTAAAGITLDSSGNTNLAGTCTAVNYIVGAEDTSGTISTDSSFAAGGQVQRGGR